MVRMVRTKMSETAARTRNRDPIAWLRMTVLQRTVYGDTLCTIAIVNIPRCIAVL